MSRRETITMACPSCRREQTVTIWHSINVSLDPGLRDTLFDGKVNSFKCESCGVEAFLAVPLLYHDMERRFCVQFYSHEHLEEEWLYDLFTVEGKFQFENMPGGLPDSSQYVMEPHVVFDLNEMMRYIVFREKLFERYN